jgi:hypothetical protein
MSNISYETRELLNKFIRMTKNKSNSRNTNEISKSNKFNKTNKSNNINYFLKSIYEKNVNSPNYIIKLINKYYNNDNVFNEYLKNVYNIQHIFPKQRRIIVIGDIHGDFEIAIKCLILGGCISYIETPINKTVSIMDVFFNKLEWIGDDTYVVQLGDQIDRVRPQRWDANDISRDRAFEDEGSTLEIFYLFYHLNELAKVKGGRVLSILGNHEIMNVDGDFRYVSQEEFKCFKNHLKNVYHSKSKYPYQSKTLKRSRLTLYNSNTHTRLPVGYKERLYAFSPSGLCANLMAMNYYTMLQIGNWLFCHGSPTIATCSKYSIDLINNITSLYLLGIDNSDEQLEKHFDAIMHPHPQQHSNIINKSINKTLDILEDDNSLLWSRTFGENINSKTKEINLSRLLNKILHLYNNKNGNITPDIKATHIAIGHTPQFNNGINTICNERVWRCDIGMSKAFHSSNKNNSENIHNNKKFERGNIQVLEILNGAPNILTYNL